MSVRLFLALVSLGVLTAACSGQSEPTSSVSRAPMPAPPAQAQSWLRVSPAQGAPGTAVSLDLACLDNLGAVRSPVLTIGALKGNPEGHQPWHLFGTGIVRSDAAPGRYQLSATCGDAELSAAFTVVPTG